MSTPYDEAAETELGGLREQIDYLRATLSALSEGGVDAVIFGDPDQEQVYALTSADRPYRVIVENMGEGATTVSERGVVLYANPEFARVLGQDLDALVGVDLATLVGAEEAAVLLDGDASGTRRQEMLIRHTDGNEVPFQIAATDLVLDDVRVRCLIFTDLTMQKSIERQQALEATLAERQRVAREVNDTIVQGLVTAEMALDLQQVDYARRVVAATSLQARTWIGQLAGQLAGESQLTAGMAVRRTPAGSGEETT